MGRAVALASVDEEKLVAFFIWRTDGRPGSDTPAQELRRAFAGSGWHVPALLDRLSLLSKSSPKVLAENSPGSA